MSPLAKFEVAKASQGDGRLMRLDIRAINHISQARKKLRSFREFITSNNASDKRENASDLVETEHKSLPNGKEDVKMLVILCALREVKTKREKGRVQ